MKNTKTKIILSAVVFLSVAGFVNTANAAEASLYVSPASLTKIVGDNFNVSVGLNASGSKVFAVEGTLVFNNLSCQSITVADGLVAQSAPTCSNPHFLIGIPNGTISDKMLVSVLVKAGNAGVASIIPTSVDIIGEGVSVGSASISGNYTINAVPKTTPTAPQNGYIGYVNGQIQMFPTLEAAQQAGATRIEPNYQRYPAGTTPAPIKKGTATVVPTTTPAQTTEQVNSTSSQPLVAAVVAAGTGFLIPMWAWLVLLAILVIGGGWWAYSRFSRTK